MSYSKNFEDQPCYNYFVCELCRVNSSIVMTLMGGTTLFCASKPNDVNKCGFVGTLRTNKPIEEGNSNDINGLF